jgi:hypothetical protein
VDKVEKFLSQCVAPCRLLRFPPIATELFAPQRTTRCAKSDLTRCSKKALLFDNLVGEREHFVGNGKAERLGRLEVDSQVEFNWLLDRDIAGLGAVEDLVHIVGGASEHGWKVRSELGLSDSCNYATRSRIRAYEERPESSSTVCRDVCPDGQKRSRQEKFDNANWANKRGSRSSGVSRATLARSEGSRELIGVRLQTSRRP